MLLLFKDMYVKGYEDVIRKVVLHSLMCQENNEYSLKVYGLF